MMILQWSSFFLVLTVCCASNETKKPLCELCHCRTTEVECQEVGLAELPEMRSPDVLATTWIDFSRNNLSRIVGFPLLVNLTKLSLAHNRISQIDAFSFFNLTSLTELDLSYNKLSALSINSNSFKGPINVSDGHESLNIRVLRLTGNEIHSLKNDIFQCLIYLEELYLDANPITMIDSPTGIAIGNLHRMKVLNMASTGIKEIPNALLYTPLSLETLNLSSNTFTDVPEKLSDAHNLRKLVLDGNPIKRITQFPVMDKLRILHLSWMPSLTQIDDYAFHNLKYLEEMVCTFNHYLVNISDKAFQIAPSNSTPQITYLPLKKLYLNDNRLSYINEELFERWDLLDDLSLGNNPWVCDCENTWFLVHLIPKLNQTKMVTSNLICAQPEVYKNYRMVDLVRDNVHLRCLDAYGNHPEKDEKVLIFLLLGTLFAVPIALIVVGYMKRPHGVSSQYPKAVYRKAVSEESFTAY